MNWSELIDRLIATAKEQNHDAQRVLDQVAAHGHPPWGIWRKLGLSLGLDINWVNQNWNPIIEIPFPTLDELFCQTSDEEMN